MNELVTTVKERLDITSKNISIKLLYQYPKWIAIGDGELDMPQYITTDTKVGVFIRMKHAIDEVGVFIVRHSHRGKDVPLPHQLERNVGQEREDGGETCMDKEE